MPYQIELHEEINTLISYISPENPTDEELKHYLDEVIRIQGVVIQNQSSRLYHILVIEPRPYRFRDGLHVIRTIQHNKSLNTLRKQLHVVTILVGQTPKSFQVMITMMTPRMAGRQVAIFLTLDAALDFVRTDNANEHAPE